MPVPWSKYLCPVLFTGLILFGGSTAGAAHVAHHAHWGLAWSEDSNWLLYHTYIQGENEADLTPDQKRSNSILNYYQLAGGFSIPHPGEGETHLSPESGCLYIANEEGLFIREPQSSRWQQVHITPVRNLRYDSARRLVIYDLAGGDFEWQTRMRLSNTGQLLEAEVPIADRTPPPRASRGLISPAPDFKRFILGGSDARVTTTTMALEPVGTEAPIDHRLATWPEGAKLERVAGKLLLHCRNGQEIAIRNRDGNTPLHVMETALSPDGKKIALVLYGRHPQYYPGIPAGFIIIYDLNTGATLAEIPTRHIASPVYGM